jgi:3-oxoacyl-[acyl-carrier protein] reductase
MNKNADVILISGSTSGIGKAIATRFIDEGYIVLQNSRNSIPPEELIGQKHYVADVTSSNQCMDLISQILKDFGRLNVLVANVGGGKEVSTEIQAPERLMHFLNLNLFSATNLISASLNALKETKGNVVAVSSICGHLPSTSAPVEYSVAKASLNSYIKSLAYKYSGDRIRFNAVAPGNVLFKGSTWEKKLFDDELLTKEYIEKNVPLNDFVSMQEVANAVHFLASPMSSNTTGTILTIDGGQSL